MPKKVPMRQCLGCREMKPKRELTRVVRSPEGQVSLDARGKAPGRGAYVCRSAECLKKAMRSHAIDRALGVTVPQELYETLRLEMEALPDRFADDDVRALARKGGNIVLGEEQAGAAARASRARLMLLASDAGGHTVRRAKSFVAGTAQPLLTLPYTRDELGDALGTTSCAIAAITDVQLALAFVKTLGEPEKYADLLQELDERVKRVEKRRAEEKAHRRNVRHGKS